AITLTMTRQPTDIMEERPRKKREILNKSLIIWFMIAGVLMTLLTLLVLYIVSDTLHQNFSYARTTALLALILLETAAAYNFTSFRHTVTFKSLKGNKYLFYASILCIAATALIIYLPFFNKIFGTLPIGVIDWGIAIGISLVFVIFFNILKKINNRKGFFKLENF
ncbi:MAG: cation-translocating P-type ATPase C-terminal domain-containing protein, partial [Candidatus Pacearchaeota archaeon]|nr:cation-translocating P-type ATPase C-terminal domain-containing protein [Candidatus Pacearchaeota archaeon]